MTHNAPPRKRYLFIRILEACTADCFMCGYARSSDTYRLSTSEFESILPSAQALSVRFVRFTGGEPLLHKDLHGLLGAGRAAGMQMSVITNGQFLPNQAAALFGAGLHQVIVSVDGASARTHDAYRNTPGLFGRCIEGLRRAREVGLMTRVNTVVGPHNYEEMPALQQRLSEIGVAQWELSAIKLNRHVAYTDPDRVRSVCGPVYRTDPSNVLVPMGKRFYGNTPEEEELFFTTGITPRPSPPLCCLVGEVIYIDAKAGRGYGCSLLPHRDPEQSGGGIAMRFAGEWQLDVPDFHDHVRQFRTVGPSRCRGCSTTAAGYSDLIRDAANMRDWAF